jgi:signal peptide peptidase SppA
MVKTEPPSFWSRIVPSMLRRRSVPVLPVVKLHGTIGIGSPLRPALTFEAVNSTLERAFSRRGTPAVLLSINSPGGSAVQSALIHNRVRQLATEKEIRVIAFCEDVAASGGYWLATAADEIYADASSIVGSIGVLYAGFGFTGTLQQLGIERRVHTAGEHKLMLDPFRPEREDDVARLKIMQSDIHDAFKSLVKARRDGRLNGDEAEIFSGAFWSGRQALGLGLVDGLGSMHEIVKQRFGDDAVLKPVSRPGAWMRRFAFPPRVGPAISGRLGLGLVEEMIEAIESRALWRRFGL